MWVVIHVLHSGHFLSWDMRIWVHSKAFAITTSSPASAIVQGIHHKHPKLPGTLQFVLLHSLSTTERLMNHSWTEIRIHRSRVTLLMKQTLYHKATTAVKSKKSCTALKTNWKYILFRFLDWDQFFVWFWVFVTPLQENLQETLSLHSTAMTSYTRELFFIVK